MFVPQGRHLLETMKQTFLPEVGAAGEVGWVKKEYINILLYYCIIRFQEKDCNIPTVTSIKSSIVTLYCSVLKDV